MNTKKILQCGLLLSAGCAVAGVGVPRAVASVAVYDNIPSTLPPDYASVNFPSYGYTGFGTEVNLANGSGGGALASATLSSASVVVSNWAGYNDSSWWTANSTTASTSDPTDWSTSNWAKANPTQWNSTGYYAPITMNFYNTNSSIAGSLIGSITQSVLVDWRPAATSAGTYTPEYEVNNSWYAGSAQVVSLNLAAGLTSAGITVPGTFIYTVSIPYPGVGSLNAAPYDILNLSVNYPGGPSSNPSVGSYYNPDETQATGTGGGPQTQTGWTGYQPLASFTASSVTVTPIPGSGFLAAVGGLALIGGMALRRRMAKLQ